MSGDHHEMISKFALSVNRPGGGCTGCVGVNIAWTPRWFTVRAGFWSYAPPLLLQGAKMFKLCWGQGLHPAFLGVPIVGKDQGGYMAPVRDTQQGDKIRSGCINPAFLGPRKMPQKKTEHFEYNHMGHQNFTVPASFSVLACTMVGTV